MSYIGAQPTTASFPFDQFSGNGSTTAFTMSYAPASTTSIVVSISGVVQNPNTYSVSGLTLTFSGAPPTGTNNIGVLYLGLPASGVTTPGNTAYLSSTEFTATAGQTTFTPSGTYQVGFINVIRNGAQLAPSDYTATNGTTVVLGTACAVGDSVVIQVYNLVSVSNALPLTGGTVTGATTFNSTVAVSGASTFSSTVSINGANGSGYTGYKNRIINGGMVIDQRNNGNSVTGNAVYSLDRWLANAGVVNKYTVQRNAGAVTPPTGFINYLGVTSSSAYSVGANEQFSIVQPIEGLNVADLGWGTANAATVTLSFWVRSSLTGTFGGCFLNAAANRFYVFSYTINAANTWEQKSVTIAGDTTGTWLTTNGIGMYVWFSIGAGSSVSGTAGSWGATSIYQPTGATSIVSTSGATWYLTGVQLERGSNATSFEFRDIGRELMLCQRYYQTSYPLGINPGTAGYIGAALPATTAVAASTAGNSGTGYLGFKVSMRGTTTITLYAYDGTANAIIKNSATNRIGVTSVAGNTLSEGFVQYIAFNNSSTTAIAATDTLSCGWVASSEL